MEFTKETGRMPSSDGKNSLFWYIFTPACNPKAIFQISHGMCEHIGRYEYEGFVRRLVDCGYVVCGNDHVGHGKTAPNEKELGFFEDYNVLAEDLHLIHGMMRKKYPHLPYILFGHSMGSFVARTYISKYDEIDGCVICGTTAGNQPLGAGIALTKLIGKIRGDHHVSKLIYGMSFAGYYKNFPNETGLSRWITSDKEVQERYSADPFCSYYFTVTGYREMFKMIKYISADSAEDCWAEKVPKSLPVLLISGDRDPLGDNGDGIAEVHSRLENAELCDLEMKLIPDGRHEPFNDVCREEFFSCLLGWCGKTVDGAVEARTGR